MLRQISAKLVLSSLCLMMSAAGAFAVEDPLAVTMPSCDVQVTPASIDGEELPVRYIMIDLDATMLAELDARGVDAGTAQTGVSIPIHGPDVERLFAYTPSDALALRSHSEAADADELNLQSVRMYSGDSDGVETREIDIVRGSTEMRSLVHFSLDRYEDVGTAQVELRMRQRVVDSNHTVHHRLVPAATLNCESLNFTWY